MDSITSSAAPRIAVVTKDENLMSAAQDWLASEYHTTLLDSYDGLVELHRQVPMEAMLIDLDLAAEQEVVEHVCKLHSLDEHLVLIGLGRSLVKMQRRRLQTAGISQCYSGTFEFAELKDFLANALQQRSLDIEASRIRAEANSRYSFGDLIGGSAVMHTVYETVARVAPGTTTVMIRGESGTGKELVA